MSKQKKWATEQELYEIIKENNFLNHIADVDDKSVVEILEQPVINKRQDRPDFLILSFNEHGDKTIYIVEVKITATLKSVAQVKKYRTTIFDLIAINGGDLRDVTIHEVIIARYFDVDLKPYFECAYHDMSFFRLEEDSFGIWELNWMDGITPKVRLEFQEKVVSFFGSKNA